MLGEPPPVHEAVVQAAKACPAMRWASPSETWVLALRWRL
jgi:hypothetical protein